MGPETPEHARGLLPLSLVDDDAFRRAVESLGMTMDSESVLLDPRRFEDRVPVKRQGSCALGTIGFRQEFADVGSLSVSVSVSDSAYRHNGVYVVIGGAGRLGEVWTRHMVSRYDADVVWIGRRAPDAEIEAKLDAVAALGRRPGYFAADASDEVVSDAALDDLAVSEEIRH